MRLLPPRPPRPLMVLFGEKRTAATKDGRNNVIQDVTSADSLLSVLCYSPHVCKLCENFALDPSILKHQLRRCMKRVKHHYVRERERSGGSNFTLGTIIRHSFMRNKNKNVSITFPLPRAAKYRLPTSIAIVIALHSVHKYAFNENKFDLMCLFLIEIRNEVIVCENTMRTWGARAHANAIPMIAIVRLLLQRISIGRRPDTARPMNGAQRQGHQLLYIVFVNLSIVSTSDALTEIGYPSMLFVMPSSNVIGYNCVSDSFMVQ